MQDSGGMQNNRSWHLASISHSLAVTTSHDGYISVEDAPSDELPKVRRLFKALVTSALCQRVPLECSRALEEVIKGERGRFLNIEAETIVTDEQGPTFERRYSCFLNVDSVNYSDQVPLILEEKQRSELLQYVSSFVHEMNKLALDLKSRQLGFRDVVCKVASGADFSYVKLDADNPQILFSRSDTHWLFVVVNECKGLLTNECTPEAGFSGNAVQGEPKLQVVAGELNDGAAQEVFGFQECLRKLPRLSGSVREVSPESNVSTLGPLKIDAKFDGIHFSKKLLFLRISKSVDIESLESRKLDISDFSLPRKLSDQISENKKNLNMTEYLGKRCRATFNYSVKYKKFLVSEINFSCDRKGEVFTGWRI